jgi:hypothetical protein
MSAKDAREQSDLAGNEYQLTYDLTYKDVVDILEVIDHSVCRELDVQVGDLKLTVIKRGSHPPTGAAAKPEPEDAILTENESRET